jgi:hypothetical protein
MKEKKKYTSSYKYNPLNPLNWSILTQISVIISIVLIIDWILGFNVPVSSIERLSFLAKISGNNEFFVRVFPLISIIIVLIITPMLNKEIDDTPFYGVILIKINLYLGYCQYTLLGNYGEFILTLTCSVVIVVVLVFMTFFEIDEPVNHVQAMLIALIILVANFLVNILVYSPTYGWRIHETWALIYILISFGGILLIHKKYELLGALPILIIALLNDYVVDFAINGFDAGAEIMKFFSGLIAVLAILNIIWK